MYHPILVKIFSKGSMAEPTSGLYLNTEGIAEQSPKSVPL